MPLVVWVSPATLLNSQAILVTQGVDDATDDRTHGFSRRIGIYIVPADWSSRGHTLREALKYPRPVSLFAAFEKLASSATATKAAMRS